MLNTDELPLLKQLEMLVRLSVAYPDSVVEKRVKRKIPEVLKKIDALYSRPFDTRAACLEFALEELNKASFDAMVEIPVGCFCKFCTDRELKKRASNYGNTAPNPAHVQNCTCEDCIDLCV